jgi:hypothetical protein
VKSYLKFYAKVTKIGNATSLLAKPFTLFLVKKMPN